MSGTASSAEGDAPILWGRGDSTNVQKVIFACAELGQPFAHRRVGGPLGGTDTDAFGALNPNRTVPVWEDGNRVLWESQAILRHLARTHGALYGSDAWAAAAVDQWLDWHATVLWPPGRLLFLGIHRHRQFVWGSQEAEGYAERFDAALAILDGALTNRDFVAGDAFSLADIAASIGVNRVWGMDLPTARPAAVAAWLDRIRARPAFAVATAEEPDLAAPPEAVP